MRAAYSVAVVTWGLLAALLSATPVGAAANFNRCLSDLQNSTWRTLNNISEGATDNWGNLVPFTNTTTAITYKTCLTVCGSGPEPLEWSVFSQQFGSWLLPWLALVSQLPFGANDNFENLISVLLTVGSPTLAAYSLAFTVLNGRWVARRFASFEYPNTRNAVRILSSLQQSPLDVTSGSLLSSLVVLPENDEWWEELVVWLDYTYTWSIAAATSIAWVVIAYVFTVIDSFTGDIRTSVNANGQGVGSLWLWLLPIVVGWLQISPKCDSVRLQQALTRANRIAHLATDSGPPELASGLTSRFAISLRLGHEDLRSDEGCTSPIFNYARVFSWVQAVETVAAAFGAASERVRSRASVDPTVEWPKGKRPDSPPPKLTRMGTLAQINEYCLAAGEGHCDRKSIWGPGIWSRVITASMLALALQWGTAGAAIVIVWFTPSFGLGCRSGGYILYAAFSTFIWMLLLTSSILSHCYVCSNAEHPTFALRLTRFTSIALRRLGKILATLNTIWVVAICTFQFSSFFDRCYCNSSVFRWGAQAYDVIVITDNELGPIKTAWIGGIFLAAGVAIIYIAFVNLFINPALPAQTGDD